MLNGAPNRRGRPSAPLMLHSNTPKHWCIYKMMQQIKQSTINYIHNTDRGWYKNIKGKGTRCKVQGAWCVTEVNCSATGIALSDILKLASGGDCLIFKGKSFHRNGPIIFSDFFLLLDRAKEIPNVERLAVLVTLLTSFHTHLSSLNFLDTLAPKNTIIIY